MTMNQPGEVFNTIPRIFVGYTFHRLAGFPLPRRRPLRLAALDFPIPYDSIDRFPLIGKLTRN